MADNVNDIGEDILEVLEELGSSINIYKYSTGESVEEYVDTTVDINHVYPWTSHYVMKADFGYNTVAEPGDLITFGVAAYYLLVALVKERFENACISKEGVIYLCNTFVQVQRRSESRDSNYDLTVTWPIVYSGEYGLFTGDVEPREYKEERYGTFIIQKDRLYISDSLDIQSGDRIWLKPTMDVSGEAREVKNIERQMYPGIKICLLGEDTRE